MAQVHEKGLNITKYQGNTSQGDHLVPVRMAIIKKKRYIKCWQGSGEKRILCTLDGNINWYNNCGKQYGSP